MRYLYMALGVVLLWGASLLWAHHSGAASERQAQAQKAEKRAEKQRGTRDRVNDAVDQLPPGRNVRVGDAEPGTAAGELKDDWMRTPE